MTDGAGARVPAPSDDAPARLGWQGKPAAPVWPEWLGQDDDEIVKVIVTGPFGAGKSTFVRAVADEDLVQTESPVSDENATLKSFSTVSLDFGVVQVPHPEHETFAQVALFGTPGQVRFEFMWKILALGMRVFIVLVDGSSRISRIEASQALAWFRQQRPDVEFLVAVNRWDHTYDVSQMLSDLGLTPHDLHRMVLSDVRDRTESLILLQRALETVRRAPESTTHRLGAAVAG